MTVVDDVTAYDLAAEDIVPSASALAQVLWSGNGLSRQDGSFAERVESGAAEHLALEHLDPIDVSFDSG